MIRAQPPRELLAAWDWTAAAGELDQLRALSGLELATYCHASQTGARASIDETVTAADILALHNWLVTELIREVALLVGADGTGTLRVAVEWALRDDSHATAHEIAEDWIDSTEAQLAERAAEAAE